MSDAVVLNGELRFFYDEQHFVPPVEIRNRSYVGYRIPPTFKVFGERGKPIDYWFSLFDSVNNDVYINLTKYPDLLSNITIKSRFGHCYYNAQFSDNGKIYDIVAIQTWQNGNLPPMGLKEKFEIELTSPEARLVVLSASHPRLPNHLISIPPGEQYDEAKVMQEQSALVKMVLNQDCSEIKANIDVNTSEFDELVDFIKRQYLLFEDHKDSIQDVLRQHVIPDIAKSIVKYFDVLNH